MFGLPIFDQILLKIHYHLALPPCKILRSNLAEINICINVRVWPITLGNIAVIFCRLKFIDHDSLRLKCIKMGWNIRLERHIWIHLISVRLSLMAVFNLGIQRRLKIDKWVVWRFYLIRLLNLQACFLFFMEALHIESFVRNTVAKNI